MNIQILLKTIFAFHMFLTCLSAQADTNSIDKPLPTPTEREAINQVIELDNQKVQEVAETYIVFTKSQFDKLMLGVRSSREVPPANGEGDLEAKLDSYIAHKLLQSLPEVNQSDGMNFTVWAGVALGSVTVVVTVLGVIMAFLTFVGYRQVIKSAEKQAQKTAKGLLEKQLEDGVYDQIILDKLEIISYRGFMSGEGLEQLSKGGDNK